MYAPLARVCLRPLGHLSKRKIGAQERNRTSDLQIRSLLLYPTELPARYCRTIRNATRKGKQVQLVAAMHTKIYFALPNNLFYTEQQIMNPAIFREYDIRGIAGKDLDASLAFRLGRAYVKYATKALGKNKLLISVGRDCRLTGEEYAGALMAGLQSGGAEVLDLGLVTTPMTYFSIHPELQPPSLPSSLAFPGHRHPRPPRPTGGPPPICHLGRQAPRRGTRRAREGGAQEG